MNTREARELANRLRDRGILTIETFRGSGPGGQHRNKTESGIRLIGRWTINGSPVELEARACLKSQHASLRAALGVLLSRLRAEIAERGRRERETESGWGGRYVRTYHQVDNRVIDHASGKRFTWSETVHKGDLSKLIEARRASLAEAGREEL